MAPTIGIQPESDIFKSPAPQKSWLPPCFIKIPDATNDFKLEVVSILTELLVERMHILRLKH